MNTGPALEVVGGGTVRVSGRIELTTDNPMAANWDGTLIMDNATIVVGDMAASSFDAFSAKTLISYGSYSNKAVDGDVTVDGLLTVGAYVQ